MTTTRDLAGKIALIIGGTRNQGAEFAKNIAARGATTIVTYRGDEQAAKHALAVLEQSGAGAEAIQSDATSSVDVQRLQQRRNPGIHCGGEQPQPARSPRHAGRHRPGRRLAGQ
jgi:NAD(P)-dependent dehydrogenase (short-subunit alcohol dehydrogenase family)